MAEQPFIQIPNTTTASVAGSPLNAQVAVDDISQAGTGPFIQQFSPATAFRSAIIAIANALSMAVQSLSGRIRIDIEAVNGSAQAGGNVGVTAQATTFAATVTAFGISSAPRPDNMPIDLMMDAWANATMPWIARS